MQNDSLNIIGQVTENMVVKKNMNRGSHIRKLVEVQLFVFTIMVLCTGKHVYFYDEVS